MTKNSKPLISIVLPVYNEAEGIEWFHGEITAITDAITDWGFEYIYINDGSSDNSQAILKALKPGRNAVIEILEFSRNFGKEPALAAGFRQANGHAVLALDTDGQHPVELIPTFIKKWQAGAEVVIGLRANNQGEGFVKRYGSRLFYSIFSKITGVNLVARTTDYRLIDRKVVNEFNKLQENNRITRGLIDWLGFRREFISFDAKARQFGTAGYTFRKLVQLAIDTFISLSAVPLFLAGYVGLFFMGVGLFGSLFIFIEQVILSDPLKIGFSGTAGLGLLTVFLVGAILAAQGLIGLYIARILNESQGRPLYIIRERITRK